MSPTLANVGSGAPPFHEWFRRAVGRCGRSNRAIALAAGVTEHLVSNLIAGRYRYPSPSNMRAVMKELSSATVPVPAAWVEAWIAEAAVFWRGRRGSRAAIVKAFCAQCGDELITTPSATRIYCDRRCQSMAHFRGRLDNKLKARFMAKVRATSPSVEQAAQELGLRSRALTAWLRRPAGRLMLPALNRVADWLEISSEEATRLQGGTAEEKRKRTVLAATQEWRQSSRFLRRQKAISRLAAAAVKGEPFSEQHKQKIGEAVRKQRRENPDKWAPTLQHTKTLRGRAQAVLRSLRQHHPELSEEAVKVRAVRRLLEPPYSVGDARVAVALLQPRRQTSKGGRPGIDYFKVIEWRLQEPPVRWDDIGDRLERDPDVVRSGYFQWLREAMGNLN